MVNLENMGIRRCVICCKVCNGSKSSDNKQNGEECIRNQLPVVFFLRKFINIPQEMCFKYLQEYGNPSLWVYWCNSCSSLIDEAQDIFHQLDLLQKQAETLRVTLKNKIISSEKKCITSSVQRNNGQGQNSFGSAPTEAIRSYILLQGDFILPDTPSKVNYPILETMDENVIRDTADDAADLVEEMQHLADSDDIFISENEILDQKFDIDVEPADVDRIHHNSQEISSRSINRNKAGVSNTVKRVTVDNFDDSSLSDKDDNLSVVCHPHENKSVRQTVKRRKVKRRRLPKANTQANQNLITDSNVKIAVKRDDVTVTEVPTVSISPVNETKNKCDDPFRCNLCKRILSNKHNAVKHFKIVHQRRKYKPVRQGLSVCNAVHKQNRAVKPREKAKCNLCQRIVSRVHLKRHRKLVHKEETDHIPLIADKKQC